MAGIGGDAFDATDRERVALGGIEIPRTYQQATLVRDRPQPDWLADELGNATGRGRQGHSGEISADRDLRRVEVAVRVEPDDRQVSASALHAGEDPDRRKTVARKHERTIRSCGAISTISKPRFKALAPSRRS